jgi:hypothetical protein
MDVLNVGIGMTEDHHVYIIVTHGGQNIEFAIGTQEARLFAMSIISSADKIDAILDKKETVN